MDENKYDDPAFFEKYSQMNRSVKGLAGAGEWPTLQRLLPDFQGLRVLDLGCGYGWHCLYAAQHGAASVVGIDLSAKMLAVAREQTPFANVRYRQENIEAAEFAGGSFDVVISSLAFHYLPSFAETAQKVWQWLTPGGKFVFSVEHPLFTSYGTQDWSYREDGTIAHFPVDNYFYEGPREATFLGESVQKYHRTLTTYLGDLTTAGFQLEQVIEPQPPQELLAEPGMKDEMRRPMMLIVAATRP